MPKTAISQPPPTSGIGPGAGPDVQGGFMFVSLSGQRNQIPDRSARRNLRAHVMHKYLDQQKQQHPAAKEISGLSLDKPSKDKPRAGGGGHKLRFRLKPEGLVQTLPHRTRGVKAITEVTPLVEVREVQQPDADRLDPPTVDTFDSLSPGEFGTLAASEQYFSESLPNHVQETFGLDDSDRELYEPEQQAQDEEFSWEHDHHCGLSTSPLLAVSSSSRIDSFGVLPLQLSRADEFMVDRFQHYFSKSWCPVNAQSAWFRYAMTDQLLLHATIYHFAMHFNDKEGKFLTRNPRVIEHKLAAIQMINGRLSDPIEVLKDESLAAVAAFVNIEIANGTREEAMRHMNGLEVMVQMRGGIEHLDGGIGGLLPRLIGWNDLNYSELFDEKLRFVKPAVWDAVCDDRFGPCFRRDLEVLGLAEPKVWGPLQGEVVVLFHAVRLLCDEVEKKPFGRLSEVAKMDRSDRFHSLERKLRIIAQRSPADLAGAELVWRACAAAGLVYVHRILRALPVLYKQFDTLCRDLQRALVSTGDWSQSWEFAPELLMWALSTGFGVSAGRNEHEWFVEQLAMACQAFGYVDYDGYRRTQREFLWVGSSDETRHWNIWREVEQKM